MSWFQDVERIVRKLRQQKAKYHAKVLSSDAIALNYIRALDFIDLMPVYVWLLIPELDYIALSLALLFDIPPFDIEPINIEFSVELPSVEELLQGILVKIKSIDVRELFKWLSSIEDMVKTLFEPWAAEQLLASRVMKGVYGVTRYGYSYYDPVAVREFLKSSFQRVWLKHAVSGQAARDFKFAGQSLNIIQPIVEYTFNKMSLLASAKTGTCILGYCVLGVSRLSEQAGGGQSYVEFVDINGQPMRVRFRTLDHLQYGFILGVTPLGFGVLLPEEGVYRSKNVTTSTGFTTTGGQDVVELVRFKGERIIRTLRYNAFSLANYNRPDEQQSYLRSERADQWMELQLLRYHVEAMVDSILAGRETNPLKIRAYKSAALQLVSIKAKRHKWGYRGFKAMSEDELYNWWVKHWETQGLNPQILSEIYNRLKPILQHLRWEKWRRGVRLKLRRYSLAASQARTTY